MAPPLHWLPSNAPENSPHVPPIGPGNFWTVPSSRVQVSVPRAQARSWADSDQVGLEAEHQGIAILVEKDFKCLTPRKNEDDGDAFPNPKTACDC